MYHTDYLGNMHCRLSLRENKRNRLARLNTDQQWLHYLASISTHSVKESLSVALQSGSQQQFTSQPFPVKSHKQPQDGNNSVCYWDTGRSDSTRLQWESQIPELVDSDKTVLLLPSACCGEHSNNKQTTLTRTKSSAMFQNYLPVSFAHSKLCVNAGDEFLFAFQ